MSLDVKNQSGFTLIELLLASTFFTFVLIFSMTAFIGINRTFQKGAVVKRVNETGRAIIEDITRNARLSDSSSVYLVSSGDSINRLCLNGVRYAWNVGEIYNDDDTPRTGVETFRETDDYTSILAGTVATDPISLAKSTHGGCTDDMVQFRNVEVESVDPDDTDTGQVTQRGATSMLEKDIIVQYFDVQQLPNGLSIDLVLSSSDFDTDGLITNAGSADVACTGSADPGSHFCSVARFKTSVTFRNSP